MVEIARKWEVVLPLYKELEPYPLTVMVLNRDVKWVPDKKGKVIFSFAYIRLGVECHPIRETDIVLNLLVKAKP